MPVTRLIFMKAMLSWFRMDDPVPVLRQLTVLMQQLQRLSVTADWDRLWCLGVGLTTAMEHCRMGPDPRYVRLLRRLDHELGIQIRGQQTVSDQTLVDDLFMAISDLPSSQNLTQSITQHQGRPPVVDRVQGRDKAGHDIGRCETGSESPKKLPQPVILVVDDSRVARRVAARILQNDYTVISAADGEAALEQITRQPPDLLLLDTEIPRMGGDELMLRLHENTATVRIPILLLSSGAGLLRAREGKCSATAWLEKPYQGSELLQKVHSLLAKAAEPA